MKKMQPMNDPISSVNFFDLVTHIPVGVCKFVLDDEFTLIYGNPRLYDLFGYTPQQMQDEINNKITNTFLPEDYADIKKNIMDAYHKGLTGFYTQHRIIKRDKSVIWVLVSGTFLPQEDVTCVYGIAVDITEQKQMEERLKINEERFRLALAQTDNTLFDYDIKTKVMIHADKSAGLYGLTHKTYNVPDTLVAEKIVHPASATPYLEMYRQIRSGAKTASCVIQAKTSNGKYAWRKISMTNIFDQEGNAVRAVGMLEDIDEQTRREELLIRRSEHDPLTGIFNKGTTENKIEDLLDKKDCSGALFIIDVDYFKSINDNYGHLFGDWVLVECAHRISNLCRHKDIVGRIGGDEFLLYLEGISAEDNVLRKAEDICNSFRAGFSHDGISIPITCTIGLSLCPHHGDSFETLYHKADLALYEAKRRGKNCCCLYSLTWPIEKSQDAPANRLTCHE